MVTLYTNDETNYDQFSYNTTYGILGIFKDCTLSGAGTLELDLMFIIDSAFREPTTDHTDLLFNWDCSDVDDLPTGLTKVGSPTNSEGGLLCDASGESITLSTSGNLDISKGTIEFWFKSEEAFDDNADHYLFANAGTFYNAGEIAIFKGASNKLFFTIVDNSSSAIFTEYSTTSIIDDNWTSWNHYRFIWNSSNAVEGTHYLALYLNGVYVTPTGGISYTSSWTDPTLVSNIGIGNDYQDTSRFMGGIMKDLFIFDQPHAKKYSSVERLEMGDQYKDTTMPTIVAPVNDRIIPANIGDYGFCADGAWHLDASSKNRGRVEPDITRHDPVLVYENWKIRTGELANFEEHLIGHWKCDDNTASTTIVDETGNYDGTLEGGDNTEDLSSTDSVRGRSLLFNGTDDYLDLSSALAGITSENKLTLAFKFKPNFAYNVGSSVYMLK
jgi:hypothetical protein